MKIRDQARLCLAIYNFEPRIICLAYILQSHWC